MEKSWIPEFVDMRFSQTEQTEWYRLFLSGFHPQEATREMRRRRKFGKNSES